MNAEPSIPDNGIETGNTGNRRSKLVLGALAVFVPVIGVLLTRPGEERLISEARTAAANGDHAAALELAERALAQNADSVHASVIAARACTALNRPDRAFEYYERVTDDGSVEAIEARCSSGELCLTQLGDIGAAEDQFLRALAQDTDNVSAHDSLAFICGLSGRSDEAAFHRLELVRLGQIDARVMYLIADAGSTLATAESLRELSSLAPDDPTVRLGLSRAALGAGDFVRAEELLRALLADDATNDTARVMLGEVLLTSGQEAELLTWKESLTESALDSAVTWWVRGEWASAAGQQQAAVRCYWESVRRNPNSQRGLYALGQALVAIGRADDAIDYLDRSGLLAEYVKRAELAVHVGEMEDFRRAAELAESLGLTWEMFGWLRAAADEHGEIPDWAAEMTSQVALLVADLPATRLDPKYQLAPAFRGDEFPLPVWHGSPERDDPSRAVDVASVSFRDDARESGLVFQYLNGGAPTLRGIVHMYEVVGGGVAVLDFDSDGWPDVYIPQGGKWPASEETVENSDRFFRNNAGQGFRDVTAACGVREFAFSQGVGVGDFDSDGFLDVYVANIGSNRLYRNNGDGTFSDVSADAGIQHAGYTTSCLMADLNNDALPDLYSVNYLAGDDLFTRVCGGDDGIPRSCLPQSFPGESDRVHLNLGDGRFHDCTDECGVGETATGKGIGIVAGDFDGSGRLSLYVANDVGPNFLFVNRVDRPGGPIRFSEEGLLRGAALNRDGNYESGMGIAAADVDGNGSIDLFVTNFDDQTNTLYLNGTGSQFRDATAAAGYGRKSPPYVAWGAQFIDAELDGFPDLILTNGHVNDLRDHGKPFQSPAQFFSNVGNGQFVERFAKTLGPFFAGRNLGRGMARIDWNRDGREDVLISHLDTPLALLTNTTEPHGGSFSCRLVGKFSARDPVGATVTVRAGNLTTMRQLLAGDGNQSSNQRLLVFGIGAATKVDEVEVRWPSGRIDRLNEIPDGMEFVLVEGAGEAYRLPE